MGDTPTRLDVHAAFRLPDLRGAVEGARVTEQPQVHLRATHWDTSDLRLLRAGVTLRHSRCGDGSAGWDLTQRVGESDDPVDRLQVSLPGAPNRPPPDLRRRVVLYTRGADLAPVARLHTRRHRTEVHGEKGALAAIVDDEVSIFDGGRIAARFRELEVGNLRDGSDRTRRSIVATLLAEGATQGGRDSRVLRALGPAARRPDDLAPPEPDGAGGAPKATSLDRAARRLSADHLRHVRRLDARVRHDDSAACEHLADALDDLVALLDILPAHRAAVTDVGRAPLLAVRDALDAVAGSTLLAELLGRVTRPLQAWLGSDVPGETVLRERIDRAARDNHVAAAQRMDDEGYVAAFDAAVRRVPGVAGPEDPAAVIGQWWTALPTGPTAAVRLHAALRVLDAADAVGGKTLRRSHDLVTAARERRRLARVGTLLQSGLNAGATGRADFAAGVLAVDVAQRVQAAERAYADAHDAMDTKRLARLRDPA